MSRVIGLSLLLALLFTTFLSFYQVHHQVRQDHQQQLTTMNQLLAKATQLLLQDDGEQHINTLFSAAQHQALFPIYSITLLDTERSVLSSTGLGTLIEQPESNWFGNEHQFHRLHHDRVLSSQPLMLSVEPTEWGYLLIEAGSPEFPWGLWFWQMLIWLMVPCLMLFVLWLKAQRQTDFLRLGLEDIEQLALRWMEGDHDLRLAQQHPLSSVFNRLFDRVQQLQHEHETQRASLAAQLVQLQQQWQQHEQEQSSQTELLQLTRQQISEQEQQWTDLITQLADTPEQWLKPLLSECVALKQRQVNPVAPTKLVLADWVALQMPGWRACIKEGQQLQVYDDPQAADFSLNVVEADLTLCCQALIRLCCRYTQRCQLALHWQLQPKLGQLQLSVVMKGESLADELCQLLDRGPVAIAADVPLDVHLVTQACNRLNARLSISCLQELGSSFLLECPVQLSSSSPPNRFEHIHCYKESTAMVPALLHNLKGLTHQLHVIQDVKELPAVADRANAPLVLVMPAKVPDEDAGHWQSLLTQPNVLMLISPDTQLHWRHLSTVPQLTLPVSSHEIMQQLQITSKPAEHSFSLLVVDDNETNQAFLKAVLTPYPFILAAEYTGKGALERCQQQRFDLILMDIQLPDMSGIEVTRQLRQQPEFQQTTILAFTAHALPEEIKQFKEAGMNDVVIKPLDSKKMTTLLRWCQPGGTAAEPSR